jgi:60 kDa SS-A/Ro ribonucleoprotein
MANKTLFRSSAGKLLPRTDTVNEAGGIAYRLPPKHALAQYAATGCLSSTFYASSQEQLDTVLKLSMNIEPEFIARTALYSREKGFMKDLPALLCAILSTKGPGLMAEIFDRVIDDARMLRNFVQILRSGVTGRKSLGTLPKRLVRQWLEKRSDDQLFRASVGNDPSLADVIKMVHPKPQTKSREALFGYLIGRPQVADALPELVKQYEAFKNGQTQEVPDVPFQMLTSLTLDAAHWTAIARKAPWQMTRMNLNTFARHGVFKKGLLAKIYAGGDDITRVVADRLRDPAATARAKVFPYQLMVAYTQADAEVPSAVREALQDAMEIAIANVKLPNAADGVWVLPDISGSMHAAITGHRPGATSIVRCVDVAALFAATLLRQCPGTRVMPFETKHVDVRLNPRDSVMTNAKVLAGLPAGGTNCSAPLAELNRRKETGDLVVYVSDNESWVDSPIHGRFGGGKTATLEQWAIYKKRNPRAKLVCIDLQPYGSTQAPDREDILNVGGFSDRVFDIIAAFADGTLNADHWVGVIEKISL